MTIKKEVVMVEVKQLITVNTEYQFKSIESEYKLSHCQQVLHTT